VMPHMNGRELAAQMTQRQPGLRVLFVSGYQDGVATTQEVLKLGDAFLQKPFSAAALARKVREVLAEQGDWVI